MNGSVARRYSRALFALAKKDGALESTAQELAAAAAVAAHPSVRQVLRNPLISPQRRQDIARIIIDELKSSDLVQRFLRLLADNQRLGDLPGIERHFGELLDAELGRVRVVVRSAVALEDQQLNDIVATFTRLTGKTVLPTVEIDPELLGGVVVEAEGRVYDGTVKTQFARIAKQLAEAVSL